MAYSHVFSCWNCYLAGRPEAAFGNAQRLVEIAERIGGSFMRSWAWFYLGQAEVSRRRWRPALEALDRARAISREHRTAVVGEPFRLAFIAESHLRLGDLEEATLAAREGARIGRTQHNPLEELVAKLAEAQVLLGVEGPEASSEIKASLSRAHELVRHLSAKSFEPHIHLVLAELARRREDETVWRNELTEAHRVFTEIGASGHAEQVAGELAVSAG